MSAVIVRVASGLLGQCRAEQSSVNTNNKGQEFEACWSACFCQSYSAGRHSPSDRNDSTARDMEGADQLRAYTCV